MTRTIVIAGQSLVTHMTSPLKFQQWSWGGGLEGEERKRSKGGIERRKWEGEGKWGGGGGGNGGWRGERGWGGERGAGEG